jgi:predicted DNA-binding protein (MmcQ/YjbR family)
MGAKNHPQAATVRALALAYPGAYEEFPWGDRVIKVNKKVFLFMNAGGEDLSLSTKLPASHGGALLFPFASPTGYGLGKSGWVTSRFGPRDAPPMEILTQWIDESYRAVAPKKMLTALDASPETPAAKPATAKRATPKKRTAAVKKTRRRAT